jgi:hypothetical protein
LTAEQLEAARSERMRQDGRGTLSQEDARTWIEETGLCLFLPRKQFSASIAPSFVEAVIGRQESNPAPKEIAEAEQMLVRLETDGVVVRLNLLGHPGEMPDFVVASWVLPYVYALRGDRDWRRSPQLTGSRQVSPLAVQAYKLLEAADTTISDLTHTLGREVTEGAVLRAITELWQQLRIIPVITAVGKPAKWQLLRQRFQKAIAEGASTSQVTAISVLASIYLQAVIAATMEDVEIFLSPLTARSKVREVLRGLMATRQVHTVSMGHSPLYYVAGTLPEFPETATIYASATLSASAYFMRNFEDDLPDTEESLEREKPEAALNASHAESIPERDVAVSSSSFEPAMDPSTTQMPATSVKSSASRSFFSRSAVRAHDSKPVSSEEIHRPLRHAVSDSRSLPVGKETGMRPTLSKQSSNGASTARAARPAMSMWSQRNSRVASAKPAVKPAIGRRSGTLREPVMAAGAKAGNNNRYGFVARPERDAKKPR